MKYYETMRDGENLGWCKPYINKETGYAFTLKDEEITIVRKPDGEDLYWHEITKDVIKEMAKAVNDSYDFYRRYDDLSIALDAMDECGCADCPWRDQCDAMQGGDLTVQEFVEDLYKNCREGAEMMDLETAREDLNTFLREGWTLPSDITPEAYMEAWNNLV